MAILNRLWTTVWDKEEAVKAREANELYKEHLNKRTAVQEMIDEEYGGIERRDLNQQALTSQMTAMRQAAALQQSIYNSHMQAMLAQGAQGVPALANAGNLAGIPPWYGQGLAQGGMAHGGNALGGSIGIAGGGIGIGTTTISDVQRWPTLGTGARDTFFMALKGIEEAAMKKPQGNHSYDDAALAIQDLRYFDAENISFMGLLSFCLSNCISVEPIITLLEGHGMKVI